MGVLLPFFGRPGAWSRALPPLGLLVAFTLLVAGAPSASADGQITTPQVAANTPYSPPSQAATEDAPLTAPDAITAMTIARMEGEPVEVMSERTESATVFALPDGTLAAGLSTGPVRVHMSGDGSHDEDWAPVDLTLERQADGTLRAAAHAGHLELSGGETDETGHEVASMVRDGVTFGVSWEGPLPEPRIEGARAVYASVRPGIDLVVEATATGFEQFFVIHERPGPGAMDLPVDIWARGAKVRETDAGEVEVFTADGEVVASMPEPLMWDAAADQQRAHPVTQRWEAHDTGLPPFPPMPDWAAARRDGAADTPPNRPSGATPPGSGNGGGNGSGNGGGNGSSGGNSNAPVEGPSADGLGRGMGRGEPAVTAVERRNTRSGDGGLRLGLAPQQDFLLDPETEYPVVIDPKLSVNMGVAFDTSVQSGITYDLSGNSNLFMGSWNSGTTVTRSYFRFNILNQRYKEIFAANVSLANYYSYSCSARSWEIWHTEAATTSTRWTNKPEPISWQSTLNTARGYSSSCPAAWVSGSVTGAVAAQAAAGSQVAAFGIEASNESDSYSWKRFWAAESGSGPAMWISYGSKPNTPSNLTISPAADTIEEVTYTSTLRPILSATVSDPEGGAITATFKLLSGSDVVATQDVSVASGGVAQWPLPAGLIQDGQTYSFTVQAKDDTALTSAPSAAKSFSADLQAPLAPFISSTDYPDDGVGHGSINEAGTFTLTPAGSTVDPSLVRFQWGLDRAPDPAQTVAATGEPATFQVTPTTAGRHVLRVQSVDRAGRVSGVSEHTFYVGHSGRMISPSDGDRVVRRVRVELQAPDASYEYVSLRANVVSQDPVVPLSTGITTSSGLTWPVTNGFGAMPADGDYLVWDAGAAWGPESLPIRLETTFCKTPGTDCVTTAEVTFVLDPNATGAATTGIGPGAVNLLTGDHILSATDVEEFGLVLARTATSRDPDAGFQKQTERLSATQQAASAVTGITAGSTTLSVSTDIWRTGGSSLRVVPAATGGTSVTFASPGGDTGGMRLGMQAGRTYRISGWIYVPSATGLSPSSAFGLRLTLRTKNAAGVYVDPLVEPVAATSAATVTDRWQHLSADVTVPAGSTEAFVRLYNGFTTGSGKAVYFDDLSVQEIWAPFGAEWDSGVGDYSTGTAYTAISRPYPGVASVGLAGGGEIWFLSPDGTNWQPVPGAQDLRLTMTGTAAAPTGFRLTELDGTYTDFAASTSTKDFPVSVTSPVVAAGATRYIYDVSSGRSVLKRVIAPIEPGVDGWPDNANACTAATPVTGCEVMELTYATATTATSSSFGSFKDQVVSARVSTSTSATPGAATTWVEVARYRYDDAGRLREVWDPRIGGTGTDGSPGALAHVNSYDYDSTGRVTSVTAKGDIPYEFAYGHAGSSSIYVDPSPGRLLTVSRASLVEGTTDELGPVNTTRVVYTVPLTTAEGGPYELGPTALASWAQHDGPVTATAIFGPQQDPGVSTPGPTGPEPEEYRVSTVHYLNASGLEVNTASPAPLGAPPEGFIDTTEYDHLGKVLRSLDATNRLLALKVGAGAIDALTEWGLQDRTSLDLAQLLDERSTYSTDGLDLVQELGPVQRLAVNNDPADQRLLRPVTTNSYDEGRPDGVKYHLVTGTTSAGRPIDGGADVDAVMVASTYTPIDGAPILGPTSGWVHKQPTTVTVDAGNPGALTAQVIYDERGRALTSIKIGSNGADAGTTHTVMYTVAANATYPQCGGRPDWAGQPCVTKVAGAVTGHDPARMSGELSQRWVNEYNAFGSPTVVAETAPGGVSRTAVTTYDAADRVTSVEFTGTGAGVDLPTTSTTYDPVTGDVVSISSMDGTEVLATVTKEYDKLGRLVRYVDADGGWTTTTYNRYGNPVTETQGLGEMTVGSRTFSYDFNAEPRGYLTGISDSVAGMITATWGPDGQLESETLPGDIRLTIDYDPARVPVSRTYTRDSDGGLIWTDSVVENHRGQWIEHESTTGVRTYGYDQFGRLTGVTDTLAVLGECSARTYGYDEHSNRTVFTSATGEQGAGCPSQAQETVTTTYDTADRLVTSSAPGGSTWTYDALGRITVMPTSDGADRVANAFYVNDLVASQTQAGVERITWGLDPLKRRSSFTREQWINDAWAESVTKVNHYGSDSDEPGWIVEDATLPTDVTRYVSGVEGDLAVSTSLSGDRVVNLVDLHGDVVGTVPVADGATQASWASLALSASDEFGNPLPLTGAGAPNAPPVRYGWLGAAQRSGEALGGVLLMGVRLYHPGTGRFTSVDPVAGGSASAYDYCNADPVNCTDLNGEWPSFKSILKAVATVGEIASMIPGPIGAAAAGVAAVAYAADGNTAQALMMGAVAAAALVGLGAVAVGVRAAAKATNLARVGRVAVRGATKVARAAVSVAGKARTAVRAAVQRGGEIARAAASRAGKNNLIRIGKPGGVFRVSLGAQQKYWQQLPRWRQRLQPLHVHMERIKIVITNNRSGRVWGRGKWAP